MSKTYNNMNIKNICLMGASFNTGNRGVSALAASLIKVFNIAFPVANIHFWVGGKTTRSEKVNVNNRDIPVIFHNYRLSPMANISEHLLWILFLAVVYRLFPLNIVRRTILERNLAINILTTSDLIGDIRGGDSFSDIYGFKRLILDSIPCFIASLVNKNFILLPQTYGPFSMFLSRWLARYTFKKARFIMSRDKEGIELIRNVYCPEIPVERLILCPDVAFMLDPIFPKSSVMSLYFSRTGKDEILVGLNVNGLMYNGGYNRKNMFGLKCDYRNLMKILVDKLLEDSKVRILFIPHTYGLCGSLNNDLDACNKLISSFKDEERKRLQVVEEEFNQSELKWIIGRCSIFIGSRMHSCIAAISQGIPTIGIAYSRKFKGVFESVGLEDTVIDVRSLDLTASIENIARLINYYKKDTELLKRDILEKIIKGKCTIDDQFILISGSIQ